MTIIDKIELFLAIILGNIIGYFFVEWYGIRRTKSGDDINKRKEVEYEKTDGRNK